MFEISDREVLLVSADVPPQVGEMDEQCQQRENTNAARVVRRQQEADAAAAAAPQRAPGQPMGNVVPSAGGQPIGNVTVDS
jgi:hypothetical protein